MRNVEERRREHSEPEVLTEREKAILAHAVCNTDRDNAEIAGVLGIATNSESSLGRAADLACRPGASRHAGR